MLTHWGKFLPAGMNCTTTDTISIPVGEMYLRGTMFYALAHTSSIPVGAINFYMQEHLIHSLIPLLFLCLRCIYMQECSHAISIIHYLLQCDEINCVDISKDFPTMYGRLI